MIKVIKRDGREVPFDSQKIVIAIEKAMKYGSGIYDEAIAEQIADEIYKIADITKSLSIRQIEDMVYHKLIENDHVETAKAYEGYRAIQEFKRENNTTDDSILGLLNFVNEEVMNENSNKNARIASTQRDLIAGEVSKDIAKRKLIPSHLIQAHDEGAIHIHDLDYIMQPIFNCCIIDLEDMLKNGTVINGKMVESPKSFQVACTVTTQIVAQVASNQYGGQSISGVDKTLAPYVRVSFEKYKKQIIKEQEDFYGEVDEEVVEKVAWRRTKREIEAGVQTIQYQINTLMTTNGQSPFLTLMLYFEEDYEYAYEAALIQEEILRQRLEGIKNEQGVYITPAFPKIIYVLDEHNVNKDSKYYYITELAAKCTAKRMYPDYISAKKMREIYEGNIFAPMGCRAFLSTFKDENDEYKFHGRFNIGVTSINLPQIALIADGDMDLFWNIFTERLELVKEMGLVRYNLLKDVTSDVSPIHWQHGAIARMEKGEKIDKFLKGGYSTVTLGYIGIYEAVRHMLGVPHTTEEGRQFALDIMNYMKDKTVEWREETDLAFALYGTPSENMAGRLCEIDKKRFGIVEDVTDKGFYVNSYHVDTRQEIDAFSKLKFEADFQKISTGGSISYIEIPNMNHNTEAILEVMKFMYDNILYAEFNTKSDYCHVCGFDGEIIINDDLEWECPQCHNKNKDKMNVVRRTCGYLGENFWGEGRTRDIKSRVLHL
ncbi:MAG TPA: anaerobic ribonucleoside-triphosphate reductase [Tissierellaceae bacterium]